MNKSKQVEQIRQYPTEYSEYCKLPESYNTSKLRHLIAFLRNGYNLIHTGQWGEISSGLMIIDSESHEIFLLQGNPYGGIKKPIKSIISGTVDLCHHETLAEDALASALKESAEEIGIIPKGKIIDADIYKNPLNKNIYITYILEACKRDMQNITLNHENTGFEWLPLSELLSHSEVHPGVLRTLSRKQLLQNTPSDLLYHGSTGKSQDGREDFLAQNLENGIPPRADILNEYLFKGTSKTTSLTQHKDYAMYYSLQGFQQLYPNSFKKAHQYFRYVLCLAFFKMLYDVTTWKNILNFPLFNKPMLQYGHHWFSKNNTKFLFFGKSDPFYTNEGFPVLYGIDADTVETLQMKYNALETHECRVGENIPPEAICEIHVPENHINTVVELVRRQGLEIKVIELELR